MHFRSRRNSAAGRLKRACRPVAEALEQRTHLSAVQLVTDINTVSQDSHPTNFVPFGDGMAFIASDGAHFHLWLTDGSANGTREVADANVSVDFPDTLTAAEGNLFFVTGQTRALWVSDGTATGTHQVPGAFSVEDSRLFASGNQVYFSASTDSAGDELWVSDGTAAGTHLVKDINPGARSSSPYGFAQLGSDIVFSADDGTHGSELWKTDGTEAGTVMISDINPGQLGSNPIAGIVAGGVLYFSARDDSHGNELWKTDGTAAGTSLVSDIEFGPADSSPTRFTLVNGRVLFDITQPGNGPEGDIWTTDGTSDGTVQFKTAYRTSEIYSFGQFGYFWNAGNLWKTDGTPEGTVIVTKVAPWYVVSAVQAGGSVYYIGEDSSRQNDQLYRTDLTTGATVTIPMSAPTSIRAVGDTVYVSGSDRSVGSELFKVLPGSDQPVLVRDVNPNRPYGSYPTSFTQMGNKLFFEANDGLSVNQELWVTDGTAGNATLLKTLYWKAQYPQQSFRAVALGDELLFFDGGGLWKSDGTVAGTVLVQTLAPGILDPSDFVVSGNKAWFALPWSNSTAKLFVTDGTDAGTHSVADFSSYLTGDYDLDSFFTVINDTAFFGASDSEHGIELWKSDGTPAGTSLVKDINDGPAGSKPQDLSNVNGTLYFHAIDATGDSHLWRSDGTADGTIELNADATFGTQDLLARSVSLKGEVYFSAQSSGFGKELWKSDGTQAGTMLVADLQPGPDGSNPNDLTVMDGVLYFSTNVKGKGQVYRSNGTVAGTFPISQPLGFFNLPLRNSLAESGSNTFTPVGHTLFFGAGDGRGYQLWRTDGTLQGTGIVEQIGPDSALARNTVYPPQMIAFGNTLFFAADDWVHGTELWSAKLGFTLTAHAGGPYAANEGQTVTLSGATSNSPGSPIVSYEWDLNFDPARGFHVDATGVTASVKALNGPATKWVALRVTDSAGNTHIGTAEIDIANVPPVLTVSGEDPPVGSNDFQLNLSSSDPGPDTIQSWQIDWGDGTAQTVNGSPDSVTHTYPSGTHTYSIVASATDEDGTYSTTANPSLSITVRAPELSIAAGAGITAGGEFKTSGTFDDPAARTDWSLTVDYGDGGGPKPIEVAADGTLALSNTYASPEVYTVTVVAADPGAHTLTRTLEATVGGISGVETLADGQYSVTGTPDTPVLIVLKGPVVVHADLTEVIPNATVVVASGTIIFRASQHLEKLEIAPDAWADLASVDGLSHLVLVLGALDDQGALDLQNNELVVHNGDLAAVSALLALGRNAQADGSINGIWNGTHGILSNLVAVQDADANFETCALGVARNGDLLTGAKTTFDGEPVTATDVLVKYTYVGDVNLDGVVDDNDVTILGLLYDGGLTSGHSWMEGDLNGDGKIDDTDVTIMGLVYGNGTGGASGMPL